LRTTRILGGLLLLAAVGVGGFTALAWQSELDPIKPPERSAFPPEKIAQGARLASLGYCAQCHTAAGGKPFAGGYPLKTPFGTIYGTNITPDPETGIGTWSEEAFARAMGEGVDREGHHLYPGFPYDHFTRISPDDNRALYAYLMTREPVRAEAPANELPWPLQFRPLLAGWKLLFLDQDPFKDDPARSPDWNRGAYLAESVAHCGACHTPRNLLGARETDRKFAGGESEGWHAPALNEASTAPIPWDQDSLYAYLRKGVSEDHALAAGPMAPVIRNLSSVPDEDIRAMATYIADGMGERQPAPPAGAVPPGNGAATVYAGACANCHEPGGPLQFAAPVDLAKATSIAQPDPRNLIQVIVGGVMTPDAAAAALMPGFAHILTDKQIAELTAYLRTRFSGQPAWTDIERHVARIRSETGSTGGANSGSATRIAKGE